MKKVIVLVILMAVDTVAGTQGKTVENLFDDQHIMHWEKVGDVNWQMKRGVFRRVVSANAGIGFLRTTDVYDNFELTLEFKAAPGSNSGIFMRCMEGEEINDENCYEANIYDTHPVQSNRTGAITKLAEPKVILDTEDGKWHKYKIVMYGSHVEVELDGVVTARFVDSTHGAGKIALQFRQGEVQFRKVLIRRL